MKPYYHKQLVKIIKEEEVPVRRGVKFYVVCPFDDSYAMNVLYYNMSKFLEFNTNRLVFSGEKNKIYPMDMDLFCMAFNRDEHYMRRVMRNFAISRIICIIQFFDHVEMLVNPNFMFYGDSIPKYLFDLFKPKELPEYSRMLLKSKFTRPEWNKFEVFKEKEAKYRGRHKLGRD